MSVHAVNCTTAMCVACEVTSPSTTVPVLISILLVASARPICVDLSSTVQVTLAGLLWKGLSFFDFYWLNNCWCEFSALLLTLHILKRFFSALSLCSIIQAFSHARVFWICCRWVIWDLGSFKSYKLLVDNSIREVEYHSYKGDGCVSSQSA